MDDVFPSGVAIVAGLLLFAIPQFFPRFSAYVLGPGVLVLAGVFFIAYKPLFFIKGEGLAGLVSLILWGAMGFVCLIGFRLIYDGRKRMAEEEADSSVSDD